MPSTLFSRQRKPHRDGAAIKALRRAAARGVKVRIWRDPGMVVRVGEADVQAQLAGQLQGIEIRPNPPGDELMHLKGYCVDNRLLKPAPPVSARRERRARTMILSR